MGAPVLVAGRIGLPVCTCRRGAGAQVDAESPRMDAQGKAPSLARALRLTALGALACAGASLSAAAVAHGAACASMGSQG